MPEVSDVTSSIESEVKFITKDNIRIGEPAFSKMRHRLLLLGGEIVIELGFVDKGIFS